MEALTTTRYYNVALNLVEEGKLHAKAYNRSYFQMGYDAYQLSQLVETEDGPRELWTLLAPTGNSLCKFLADAWDMPYSSLQSALGMISFYHALLGWDLSEMESIGRARLSSAKSWLALLLSNEMTDPRLLAKLKDREDIEIIEAYVRDAKETYARAIKAPKVPQLGTLGAVSVVEVKKQVSGDYEEDEEEVLSSDNSLSWEEEEENVEEDTEEEWSDEFEDDDLVTEAEASELLAKAAASRQKDLTAFVQISSSGEPLHRYVMRLLQPHLREEQVESVLLSLQSRLGDFFQYPLVVFEDNLPTPVGIVVINNGLEDSMGERVLAGLRKKLGNR